MIDESAGPEAKVLTSSRFQLWWLTKIHGYRIFRGVRVPRRKLFGRVVYDCKWWLVPPVRQENES